MYFLILSAAFLTQTAAVLSSDPQDDHFSYHYYKGSVYTQADSYRQAFR